MAAHLRRKRRRRVLLHPRGAAVDAGAPVGCDRECIVHVGQVGASCEAAYSATKGALIALTKALAKELGPSNIRVNAVAPGVIQTDMCSGIASEVLESLRKETPIERLGAATDIAQAVAYLADAPFVTGQILGVNGGFVIT